MFPLRSIIEVVNIDLLTSREQMMKQSFSGFGPPDLVILTKVPDKANMNDIVSSHHLVGFPITDASSFPNYYDSLLKLREGTYGRPKFNLKSGLYCCWNSFAEVDIRLDLSIPGSYYYYPVPVSQDKEYKISELTWRELSICTALRFWRGFDPIFSSLFDIETFAFPGLNTYGIPLLEPDDIRFAVAAHPSCDELEISVAHILIARADPNLFFSLLEEFSSLMPRILVCVFKYVPLHCPIFDKIYNIFIKIMSNSIDNVLYASTFVDILLKKKKVNECTLVVPLLMSSLSNDPLAGIALGKICVALNKPGNAIAFYNAACLSQKPAWRSKIVSLPNMPMTQPKEAPLNKVLQIEKQLLLSQLSGTSFHLYRALAEMARDIGSIKMQSLMKKKYGQPKADAEIVPFLSLYPIIEPEEFSNTNIQAGQNYLYDPGVENEPNPPKVILDLPISQKFLDLADVALHDFGVCETIKRNQEFPTEYDILKAALLALKVGDFVLAEMALKKVKEQSVFTDLLNMRLGCETKWSSFENLFHAENKKTTIDEHNALLIAKKLAESLQFLVNNL